MLSLYLISTMQQLTQCPYSLSAALERASLEKNLAVVVETFLLHSEL